MEGEGGVDSQLNVLFLCTGNSARSVLGEALLNSGRYPGFRGYSAGSRPKGMVHPMSVAVLADAGIATAGLRSKSWDEFAAPGAPRMDHIITVCDNAAGEACPIWPGRPATQHWGLEDPAAVDGDGQRAAFEATLADLRRRLDAFTGQVTEVVRTEVSADDGELRATLTDAHLPIDDLDHSAGRFFRFERNHVLVGFGGFEPYGADALLRSIVVVPDARGTGAGRAIASALEEEMRATGVRRAYLLTNTAEAFFRHLGFGEIARSDAPAAILNTPQATTICTSAAMMRREL